MKNPDQTTAAAFPRYSNAEVLADSAALHWAGMHVRLFGFPRIVDRFLVPATPEPLISCVMSGSGEFQERELGGPWQTRQLQRGEIFITRASSPYEIRCQSPVGDELKFIVLHLAVDQYLSALEAAYPGRTHEVDVIDYFGKDEVMEHLCFVCAGMLEDRVPGDAACVGPLLKLVSSWLVGKYTDAAIRKPDLQGGLPIRQLRKVEDFVREKLEDPISVESLASLVDLSPFHFSRVFKQATGMTPLEFVTRERITRAQQFMRETTRSLIEIALDVGYTSPSHFAQVFRRVVGVTPTTFRSGL